jgi:hypothetical protein
MEQVAVTHSSQEEYFMKPSRLAILGLGVLLVLVALLYLWPAKSPEPPIVMEPDEPVSAPETTELAIRHPLPEPPTPPPGEQKEPAPPLPDLAESDPYVKDLLSRLYEDPSLRQLLVPQHFVRRMVLIIDALPKRNVPMQHLPLRKPSGQFQTEGEEDAKVIGTRNAGRYTPYVRLAEAVPAQRLAATYLRIYPILEQAYRELGHPQGYFHDRMIAVLDLLLATPEVDEPIPLVGHVKVYRFADPELEALSSGQKVLLRMGGENARRVKAVLQKLRDQLVTKN